MKKIFTMMAMALMTLGANAQTTIASWNAGTVNGGTFEAIQSGEGNVVMDYSGKYNVNSTSVTCISFTKSITDKGEWQATVKVTGEFKAGDVVTIQPFTQMGANDKETKYANILMYNSNKKQIANLTNSASGALTVTNGYDEEGEPKAFSYTLESDYTELYFGRGGNTRINLMKIVVTRETGGDDPQPTETETIASWNLGTINGGTWSATGTVDMAYEKAKIDNNSTSVKPVITFPNSFKTTTKDDEGNVISTSYNYLKVSGEFKKGDVVTIQPFTQMSSTDILTKYANIYLYSAEDDAALIKDLTGSASGVLTVTDGHEQAGSPKEFTYTLENDYTELLFARNGGTRINLMKVVVTRSKSSTAVETVKTRTATDGMMYNLAGQKVGSDYKGIAIMNGRKVVVK